MMHRHQQPEAPVAGATVNMKEPMCLIDTGLDGRMSVQQGALQILEQIKQPVVVVAVVGLYRTGKSYLMNRLAGKQRGFALGRTIESKTKGIWMWCLPHPFKDGHTLVLLDTEGLGDVEKGNDKHDTWIFCLAVLLSSTLVYNSLGTIDNVSLEKLQFVTQLTEHIRVKSTDYRKNTELMRIFPSFVWTVRDFMLDLELNGKPITADQYLENSLKLKSGSTPEVENHNKVRRSLKEFFAELRCFVMEHPTSATKMKRMEELTDVDLEPSFVQQAQQFCTYVHQQAKVKTMREGRGLTGRMLGCLAEMYVEAISSGKVPCLENAMESLAQIQNSRAMDEALKFYQAQMTQNVQFPTETQEALSMVHQSVEKKAIVIFIEASFNDQKHQHQKQLQASIEEQYGELCKRNVKESREVCWNVIHQVFASLEKGLSSGSYMKPGGHKTFCSERDRSIKLYRSKMDKKLMGEEVLTEYLEQKHVVVKAIQDADRSLTEAERREAEESTRRAKAEQEQHRLRERNRIQNRVIRDLQESNEEHARQVEMKMEDEWRRKQEELERVQRAQLKNLKESKECGLKGQAQMQEEINRLKREREEKPPPKGFWSSLYEQGNAPSHAALSISVRLEDHHIKILPWPAQCPGLSDMTDKTEM